MAIIDCMTKYFIHIIFALTSLTADAQFDWDSKNADKKILGFGCSFDGSPTKPVSDITEPFLNKDFDKIRKTLNSKLLADKFLAVILLEQLNKKKELELTNSEHERISEIKSSTELVPVCSGCTYWMEHPLNELLNEDHLMYQSAMNWFKTYYKIYYKKAK